MFCITLCYIALHVIGPSVSFSPASLPLSCVIVKCFVPDA